LRRERDEAREEIASLKTQLDDSDGERVRLSNQQEELAAKRILCTELSERLARINSELIAERKKNGELEESLKEYERENEAVGRAKSRAADLEFMAYKRAEAIEAEAVQNTEKARGLLKRLVADTRSKYTLARNDAEGVAYGVLQELGKLTEWFNEFPRLFDTIDDKLDSMQAHEKPMIKAFVPHQFDEEGADEQQSDESE